MNPVVAAAFIGVSGTVIVGVAGFGASIWNTTKTIAHAQESRVWDQRATVYVDVLAAVHYRGLKRDYGTKVTLTDDDQRQQEQAILAAHQAPDWNDLEARLLAFASEPILAAVRAGVKADEYVMDRYRMWQTSDEIFMSATTSSNREVRDVMHTSLWNARIAADTADDTVIELIRAALQGRHASLGVWHSAAGRFIRSSARARLEDQTRPRPTP